MAKSQSIFLSKTTFLYGCQCVKRLWLHKHLPQEAAVPEQGQEQAMNAGTTVGELARKLFPEGVLACEDRYSNRAQALITTQQLMANGCKAIYEAAFEFDQVIVFVDLLTRDGNKWIAWEVKSTTSVKEYHKLDVAIQYYVLSNAGVPIRDFRLLMLNNEYVRFGELDLNQLFRFESLLDFCKGSQLEIASKLATFRNVLRKNVPPEIEVGSQCENPFQCDFYDYCAADLETQVVDHGEPTFQPELIREFLDEIEYPLYFLDFETWRAAVPEQDGHWPYRQIPFQFSLHIRKTVDAPIAHKEYLASDTSASLEDFALQLLNACGKKGSIVVYNRAFESTCMRHLAEDYPDLADGIQLLRDRLIDLMVPFRRRYYYIPEMQSSYSIKKVLPALFPNLKYDDLAIGDGNTASQEFYNLKDYKEEEQEKVRQDLLAYCKLDTWAMVCLLDEITNKLKANEDK